MKMKPNNAKNATVTDPLANENRRFSKRRASSMGAQV